MKKSFIYSFYTQPFQLSYHSKSEAVAWQNHVIHGLLTVRFLTIPNGKWFIPVLYNTKKT